MKIKEYPMTAVAPTVSLIINLPIPKQATGPVIEEIVESLKGAKKIAILAPDALGLLTWEKWKNEMPFFTDLASVNLLALRAVMPSITPVNFATMVSGCDQSDHSIQTYDDCFQCETLFDILRKAGLKSVGIGRKDWTGSRLLGRNADICGTGESGSDEDVERLILEVAKKQSPIFLIAQIGITDNVFHHYGVLSPNVIPFLQEMDNRLRRIVMDLRKFEYGILILSDHGQHDYIRQDGSTGGTHGTNSDEDCLVPLTWTK